MHRIFLSLAYLFLISLPNFGLAQNDAGIGLKPATIEEGLSPGEVKQFTVYVSNVSGIDQNYYIFKRDITGVRDGGVPVFADEGQEKTNFELSEWITLETDRLEVPHGQEKAISFTMEVPENAAPGSHFGGIFVSAEPPEMRQSGAAIGYEVANIVSIRVAGEAAERGQIRQFSTDNYFYGKSNVEFSVRFENSGNTLLRPRGPLTIHNMFGKEVANMTFNQELAGVFPGNTREFLFNWSSDQTGFGRYEAILNPNFGEAGAIQSVSSTVTFWILPMNIIMPAVGVLAVLLLITYVCVRLYVNRKLAYYGATGGTRKLVRRRATNQSTPLILILIVMLGVTAFFLLALLVLFA
jgi:hypothetical protein